MDKKNKAKELCQWYTKPSVAEQCTEIMCQMNFIDENTNIVEPSAGTGAFINAFIKYVPKTQIFAYDIDPKQDDIIQNDWLENRPKMSLNTVVIGNPPYGKKGKLAIEFINKSFEVSNIVGFIVPKTLSTSWTAQKNVDENAALIYEKTLEKNSFIFNDKNVDVPSVFQIWQKRHKNIRLTKPETEHPDLEIKIYNKTEGAEKWLDWNWDIAVKRNSKKGEYILQPKIASKETHWILIKGNVDILKKIDWSSLNDNKMTAGMGKADVIKAYKEVL